MIGWTVIPQGERALIWNRFGAARVVDGPTRVLLITETAQALTRHAAGPEEFLVIEYKDGRTEHARGPTSAWLDPITMEEIRVAPMTKLDANEAIVVYRPAAGGVQRRIERGPAL